MIVAPALEKECPHCGEVKRLSRIVSGNTIGGVRWSDTKSVYPMLPRNSTVQRCPKCGNYYFMDDARTVSPTKNNGSGDFLRAFKNSSSDTGTLCFSEAREALEQLYDSSSDERRFVLRLYVLYAYNDEYGRNVGIGLLEDEVRPFFIENCLALAEMPQTSGTLKAELYREVGDFGKCLQTLDSLAPAEDYEQSVRERIHEKALQGDAKVFKL